MPQTATVQPYGLENALKTIAGLVRGTSGQGRVEIDLAQMTFVRPPTLALLCAYIDQRVRGDDDRKLRRTGVSIIPPRAANIRRYLETMNLIGAITEGLEQVPQLSLFPPTPPSADAQHIPLSRLRSNDAADEVALRLRDILLPRLPPIWSMQAHKNALYITLAELLENFTKHAESQALGFACAQYYPPATYRDRTARRRVRRGVIDLAIADTGIGIDRSLRAVENLGRRIDDGENPCTLATGANVTSKPDKHSGYGLYVTRRLAELNLGNFLLISGRDWCGVSQGRRREGRSASAWPGTFVGIHLYVEQPIELNRIYNELPPAESDEP